MEYSSREVSPAPLLLSQILTAYRIFTLHHGPTIGELYAKSTKDKFCAILDRFWTRFCRNWEVLLHGNPAVDVFGGLKLASGGELGVGVGEEEWGSGEREVLEDLVRQTEGLVDLIVSRFGDPAAPESEDADEQPTDTNTSEHLPWLGGGDLPNSQDGVIFGGTSALTRSSLRDLSSWVQQIYTYGEHAYGVKDNPQRQRRKRRRQQAPAKELHSPPPTNETEDLRKKAHDGKEKQNESSSSSSPHAPSPKVHDRVASHDHATGRISPQVASHPGIPPPIVTAAEESLNAAAAAAQVPDRPSTGQDDSGPRYGISDKWMKYLTLGLSSGDRSSIPKSSSRRPTTPRRTSSSSSKTITASSARSTPRNLRKPVIAEQNQDSPLQTLDPAPDGHAVVAQLAAQRYLESKGYFLIGVKGDLDRIPTDGQDDPDAILSSSENEGERNILRTLQVQLNTEEESNDELEDQTLMRTKSNASIGNSDSGISSLDAPKHHRLRVLVYVHRPFIYTFLFEQRSPRLQISSFYSTLHNHLRPLHKPLLRSTSVQNVSQRIADSHMVSLPQQPESSPRAPLHNSPRSSPPVFDLVHDPVTLTTHTSIPNIPDPGTPAAEGIGTTSTGVNFPPVWTRVEAINVHSQILNTLAATSTKAARLETERTSKTSRGWWIVWMRIPSTPVDGGVLSRGRDAFEDCRCAFLVRKASDGADVGSGFGSLGMKKGAGPSSGGSRISSGMSGMFGFGRQSASSATVQEDKEGEESAAESGVGWGLGIDARKYVEGILSLNR